MDAIFDLIIDILSVPMKKWDNLKFKYKIIIFIVILLILIGTIYKLTLIK